MNLKNSPHLMYWGAWTLAGAYNFVRDVFDAPWRTLLLFNFSHFLVWGLLGLVAIPLMRRYPMHMHWRPWLLHLLMGTLLTQIDITTGHWLFYLLSGSTKHRTLLQIATIAFKNCFHLGLLTYACLLGIVQGLDAQKLARARELQVAEHKTAFIQAQLQSLKTQLQPHFLFNTLHAIASLMHYDVPTADRMLNRLSELLRISLRETATSVVSLKQEMSFIEAYLEIEKIRFESRLEVAWLIPDDLHGSAIPPFILQPLVENAIKYGVAPRADGGNIVIRAYADQQALLLEVEDDAPLAKSQLAGFGIGLSNTRSRLETLYGSGQSFELIRAGMGTIARIRLPLSQHGMAAA